ARRLLAPALDLGQVLRRNPGPLRDIGEPAALLLPGRTQTPAEDLTPQRLRLTIRSRAAVRREPGNVRHTAILTPARLPRVRFRSQRKFAAGGGHHRRALDVPSAPLSSR